MSSTAQPPRSDHDPDPASASRTASSSTTRRPLPVQLGADLTAAATTLSGPSPTGPHPGGGSRPDRRRARTGVRPAASRPAYGLGLMGLPRRQRTFIVVMTVLGLFLYAVNIVFLNADPAPHSQIFFLVAVIIGACVLFSGGIEVKRGTERLPYRFWEYPAIVGLALAPDAPYLVVTALLTSHLALMTYQVITATTDRWKYPAFFGFSGVALTVGAYVGVLAPPWTFVVGCVLGGLIFDFFFFLNDYTVLGPTRAWAYYRDGLGRRIALSVTLATAVTLVILVFGTSRGMIMAAPATILLGYWAMKWRQGLAEQQAAWAQFENLPDTMVGLDDVPTVISETLRKALEIFDCTSVQIAVHDELSITAWQRDRGDGSIRADPLTRLPDPNENLGKYATRVPLQASGQTIGYLTMHWPPSRDIRPGLVRVFTHYVASAIANARHNSAISLQAAEKAREATIDPLTRLGNRARLYEVGPGILEDSRGLITHTALLLLDLDGFKAINDTLGHAAGDAVIEEIGQRITAVTRREDLAIRLGGDEFAILVTDLASAADAKRIADKITKELEAPVTVDGLGLSVEFSIGIAIYQDEADTIDELLKRADIAMYEAKARGKGQSVIYEPSMFQEKAETLLLATDLRRALTENDELVLHYQPQVDLATGRVIGVEALVRWQHPTQGLLAPDVFVPLAEHSGTIRQFTLYVVQRALRDRLLMRQVLPDATVSVNLSRRNLLDRGLATDIQRALDIRGVEPAELVLEVTETASPYDQHATEQVLAELRGLGCHLAMDDFGSGYATFESIHGDRVPISEIKIDRAFVRDLDTSRRDRELVAAMIRIAKALDCRVVAEGVETATVLDILRDMGCDAAQGYHLMRPSPLFEVLEWARTQPGAAPATRLLG